jgi:hypothetical protein
MCNGEFESYYCPVHWREVRRMKRISIMAEYIYLVIMAAILYLTVFHLHPVQPWAVSVALLAFAFLITVFCEGDNAWKSYFARQEN